MDELVRAFRTFLHRDLAFLLGGSCFVAAFLSVWDRLPSSALPLYQQLFAAGVAYVVGYAVQDLFTLLRLVRTRASVAPNKFLQLLYKLFERRPLPRPDFNAEEFEAAKRVLLTRAPALVWEDHKRLESLKQVGTTLGPCLLLSGALLLAKPLLSTIAFETAVACTSIATGFVLWLLGWVKVVQQGQNTLAGGTLYENDPVRPTIGSGE